MTKPKTTESNLPAILLSREGRWLRLPLSALPSEHATVKKVLNAFRRLLEGEVLERHKSINASHAALIQTACRFEQMTKILERIMTRHWDTLEPLDQASLLDRVGKYSQQRDQAITKLGLDVSKKRGPNWNGIDAKVVGDGSTNS
ncbi:hypothetical protein K2Y11_21265 [bacterium]|nr:hypothetical protein [bacterium]